jgi:2'-5' RNA ligase
LTKAPTGSRRLFIGLMVTPAVQVEIVRHRQAWAWSSDARLTPPANLHLTVDFLGDVAAAEEHALRGVLARVGMLPFELRLRTPKIWPKGLAILEPERHHSLEQLHSNIGLALEAVDFGRDPRPWSPHVTLAREAEGSHPPPAFANIAWKVDGFSLVCSRPMARPAYEVLETWPTVSTLQQDAEPSVP